MAVGSPSKNNAPLSGFHLFFTSDQGLHVAEKQALIGEHCGVCGGALLCEQKDERKKHQQTTTRVQKLVRLFKSS